MGGSCRVASARQSGNRPAPTAVIPAKAGIQKRNAAGLYRKKQKPDRLDSRLRGNDEILDYGNLSGMIESIGKTTGIYQKNRNPTSVISAKAGIQKHNVTGIYRKKQKPPPTVIPAQAGIQTRRHGNLPDKTVSLDSTS